MKIHLSIDDVSQTIICEKIWNNSFFKYLRFLHDRYNCSISLYLQEWKKILDLNKMCLKEFAQNADWLKVGIHVPDLQSSFASLSYEKGMEEWNSFVDVLVDWGGCSIDNIDCFPRLHTFAGNEQCLKGMANANRKPAIGFLCADDARESYYFDDYTNNLVYRQKKILYDETNMLYFKATDIRLDWFDKKFSDANYYSKPQKRKPYKELKDRQIKGEFSTQKWLIVFTHEWQLYKNGHLTFRKKWLKDICRFAEQYKYPFGFLMEDMRSLNAVSINEKE